MSADGIVLSKFRLNIKLYINFISARKEVLDIFFPFTYTAAIKLVPFFRAAFKMKRCGLSVLSYSHVFREDLRHLSLHGFF